MNPSALPSLSIVLCLPGHASAGDHEVGFLKG